MNPKSVERAKSSVCKVIGTHRGFNYNEPYVPCEESIFGGTAFFVDHEAFGDKFPAKNDHRYLLTNFHVVDSLENQECQIYFPSKGNSCLRATVAFAVPSLDCAILEIDVSAVHPFWYDGGNIREFLSGIPNLQLDLKQPIKGNSQKVTAIGFPNLSKDYQLCTGVISGRGLGMIQLSISLNGGNSGGPLMLKNKVIGINTATISDSESLGLAIPIYTVGRFFNYWTNYESILLSTPSWGMATGPCTDTYLEYHDVEASMQGCSVDRIVEGAAMDKGKIKTQDIILGISSGDERYNVDRFGLVSVPWCDTKVPVDDQEFILNLDPGKITIDIFKWHGKKIKRHISILPEVIDFEVREVYHQYENVDYCVLGGAVFQNLTMNHLELDEDEEEALCPPSQAVPLANLILETMNMQTMVIVSHIPNNSYVKSERTLKEFDRALKCNGVELKSTKHLSNVVARAVRRYSRDNTKKFISLETSSGKVYLDMEKMRVREVTETYVPEEKLQLRGMEALEITQRNRVNKRKRTY